MNHRRNRLLILAATLAVALAGSTAACTAETAKETTKADPLIGPVWQQVAPDNGLPGVMLVFLPNGALLMDSCWETYALRKWTRTGTDAIEWDEDGAKVAAKIASLSATELVLDVKAGPNTMKQRYAVAKVPYLCPDMKR